MERRTIRILKDTQGHDQDHKGITLPVRHFKAGEVVEVHASLASAFCDEMKVAEPAEKAEQPKETAPKADSGKKALKGAPENKARG